MNFFQIRAYDNYVTANLELALLREAGVDCHLKDEYTITIDPLLSPAIGGMKLMVTEGSVNKALELLRESDQLYLQSVPCPVCKHPTLQLIVQTTEFKTWAGKLKSMLINGQEQEVKQFYRCNNCDHTLSVLPENS